MSDGSANSVLPRGKPAFDQDPHRVRDIAERNLEAAIGREVRNFRRQQGLTVGDLRRAFAEANPDWRGKRVGVLLSRRGWLRELRLCYGRNFMPADCPRRSFGPPDSAALKIWRGL